MDYKLNQPKQTGRWFIFNSIVAGIFRAVNGANVPALLSKELQSTTATTRFWTIYLQTPVPRLRCEFYRDLEVAIQSLSREEKILFRAWGSSSTMSAYAETQSKEGEIDQNRVQHKAMYTVRQGDRKHLLVDTRSWVLPRHMKGEKVLAAQLTHCCFLWIFSWLSEVAKPRPLLDLAGSAVYPNIRYWL